MQMVETQASQLARALNDTVTPAAVGVFNGMTADLYQAQLPVSPSIDPAVLAANVCNYVGYAQKIIVWELPSVADDGTVEVQGTFAVPWRPTNGVTPNVAWGIYCTAAVGGALLFLGQFDGAPLPMASNNDVIRITFRYRPASNSLLAVVS